MLWWWWESESKWLVWALTALIHLFWAHCKLFFVFFILFFYLCFNSCLLCVVHGYFYFWVKLYQQHEINITRTGGIIGNSLNCFEEIEKKKLWIKFFFFFFSPLIFFIVFFYFMADVELKVQKIDNTMKNRRELLMKTRKEKVKVKRFFFLFIRNCFFLALRSCFWDEHVFHLMNFIIVLIFSLIVSWIFKII